MANSQLESLLNEENEQLKKLHSIVSEAFKEEELIVSNLLNPPSEILNRGQKISDKVARFGGSWNFIIVFSLIIIAWLVFNVMTPGKDKFDPFPFILLNLILSCVAALQAPIIMMSQNRKEEKDRKRAENDYLVNLKAELEIRSLHQKIDLLLQNQIKTLYDLQHRQLDLLNEIYVKMDK
jgi:uncharacterized membrane protein